MTLKSLPQKYFIKIALANFIIGVWAILCTVFICHYFVKNFHQQQIAVQMRESLVHLGQVLLSQSFKTDQWCPPKTQASQKSLARYTLIDSSGVVLCDSIENRHKMENHKKRPEFLDAIKDGWGFSIRYGKTLQREMVYGAIALEAHIEGQLKKVVLRKSIPLSSLDNAFFQVEKSILLVLMPLFFLFSFFSLWRGLTFAKPLTKLLEKIQKFADVSLSSFSKLKKRQGVNINTDKAIQDDIWEHLDNIFSQIMGELKDQGHSLDLEKIKLGALLNSLSDPTVAFDQGPHLLFYNPAFERTFFKGQENSRLSSSEPRLYRDQTQNTLQEQNNIKSLQIGKSLRDVFFQEEIILAFEECLQNGLGPKQKEIQIKDLNFILTINPLIDGETVGVVAVFHNTTKFKLVEKMRVDFVANVSHEVRTPLTSLQGFLDVLMSHLKTKFGQELDVETNKYFEKIFKSTERLLALFQDLLNLSLLEAETDLFAEVLDLEALTLQIIQMVASREQGQIKVYTQIKEAVLDRQLLEQILTNLLENALKYAKGVPVKIEFKKYEEGLLLIVEDQGPGVPKEYQERIFERFFRLENSRGGKISGTGLGLSIVKHAAMRHRGRVWMEDGGQGGSRFCVYLKTL